MADFSFVSDEILRGMLERDKKELDQCQENGLCKATMVLSGSIIEAVLVDYFLAFPPQGKIEDDILKVSLGDLVDWAAQGNLISPRTKQLSSAIRGYRNLIHPGRERRLSERIDVPSANVAANLVEIVVQEIGENYAKRRGYTAEQAIGKVRRDPACSSILRHMVYDMSPNERVKLFRLIPSLCITEEMGDTAIDNFIQLHEILTKEIPLQVVEKETAKVYNYLQNRGKVEVLFYLRFFYRRVDVLEPMHQAAVLTYLLAILEKADASELKMLDKWRVLDIGRYLDRGPWKGRLSEVIWRRLRTTSPDGDEAFLSILEEIFIHLDTEFKQKVTEGLRAYGTNLRALAWADKMDEFF